MNKLECSQNAAEIHKKVRSDLNSFVKPGVKLIDICNLIEDKVKLYSSKYGNQVNNSIAFPTGISINNVAAHWTPSLNDTRILKETDICKIDFGVHLNGWIIDSAFTVNYQSKYEPLLDASKEAVKAMINHMGVDTCISELGTISEEIVKSYEIEDKGILKPILPIDNLTGHSIDRWNIHSGKFIPNIKNNNNQRISEDEFYAIEVFTSNGLGTTKLDMPSNHFMLKETYLKPKFKFKRTNNLLNLIKNNFSTLAFCPRFIEKIDNTNYNVCLQELFNNQIINSYPPLIDIEGSKTAQFEHTIYINEDKKIILSKGNDY